MEFLEIVAVKILGPNLGLIFGGFFQNLPQRLSPPLSPMTRETVYRTQKEAASLIHKQLTQLIALKKQTDDENENLQRVITELSALQYQNKRKDENCENLNNLVERNQHARSFSSGVGGVTFLAFLASNGA